MDTPVVINPAPDWTTLKAELRCPLCEYNLRGLDQPRCPECGFAFEWAELIRGQEHQHPYLFEHQTKRHIWSFWKTYWADCRPRKFWRELSPAHPVNLRRLILFWIIANFGLFLAAAIPVGWNFYSVFSYGGNRFFFAGTPSAYINRFVDALMACTDDDGHVTLIFDALLVLAWPWATLGALLVFSQSMRMAKINKSHVLRAAIYGGDFGFLLLIAVLLGWDSRFRHGYPELIMLLCSVIMLYRTSIAYRKYLRFHLPFWTVLTSQVIVLMMMFIVYITSVPHW